MEWSSRGEQPTCTSTARRAKVRISRKHVLFFGMLTATLCSGVTANAQGTDMPHKVAVVDVARILKEHKGIQAQVQRVEQDLKDYDGQLAVKRDELKKSVELLKTYAVGSPEYTAQEEKIADTDSRLRLEMTRKRKELVDAEAKIYYENYKLIADAVKRIAEFNKIDLVLRYNGEEMSLENQETVIRGVMKDIVYRNERIDMTAGVMQMLDQMLVAKANPAGAVRK
jgi:Skp family chaperone for outer membrane proteins